MGTNYAISNGRSHGRLLFELLTLREDNNKLFITDCRDKGDYRKSEDERDNGNHTFKCMGDIMLK